MSCNANMPWQTEIVFSCERQSQLTMDRRSFQGYVPRIRNIPGSSMRQRLESIARRWITEGWQKGNSVAIDVLHAKDFVDRDSADRPSDNAGFKHGIERLYVAFPDFHAVVDGLVVDED